MVTHVFDNSNLSQGSFAIDTWGALICSLGHGRKHMLKPGLHISPKDRKHRLENMFLSFPTAAWSLYGSNDHRH